LPAQDAWPIRNAWQPELAPDGDGPGDDYWDDDEDPTTYPLTYERDDYAAADPQPAPVARPPWEQWEPWPPAPDPAASGDTDTKILNGDDAGERAPGTRPREAGGHGYPDAAPPDGWTDGHPGLPGDDPADWTAGRGGRGGRRWLIVAGVVVAGAGVGAAAVLLTSGHPAAGDQGTGGPAAPGAAASAGSSGTGSSGTGRSSTGRSSTAPSSTAPSSTASSSTGPADAEPLTMTQAKSVLAAYTTANNSANAQRSDATLATVETGSSEAIDAGLYQEQQASGTAPYPAFGPAQATYYLPRNEPAGGPRWFVVQVANAFTANPQKVTSTEYLLFTQPAGGGAWQDTIEPYLLSGGSAPPVEVGADGLATAVSPDAATVAVMPSQLPAATATALDGTGTGQATVASPGNLTDLADQKFWQGKVAGGTVTDTHTAAAGADGQEFALLTADGGALVFYTDAAELTITPPAGSLLRLTVPGFYSPAQPVNQATLSYLEQFAADDPPAGGGAPSIVADYSGITGKN